MDVAQQCEESRLTQGFRALLVMPGLSRASTSFLLLPFVDGRDTRGHDVTPSQ